MYAFVDTQKGPRGTRAQAVKKARLRAIFSDGEALFAYSPAARRAAKSVRKALLRKAAETDVHAAGFGPKIGGLRPSDASQGFFDSLMRDG